MHTREAPRAIIKSHKVEGALATSWQQLANPVALQLRKGVKFHDGTPFTADGSATPAPPPRRRTDLRGDRTGVKKIDDPPSR
jgi:hypothetical protein